jgi:hypothetical protein
MNKTKLIAAVSFASMLLAATASMAHATTVNHAGENFEAVSSEITLAFPSANPQEEWTAVCDARFTGKVPSAPDNPNSKLGHGGSVVTTITPFEMSNCRIFGLPAEVKTLAPTNWTMNWNAYRPQGDNYVLPEVGSIHMMTVAVPHNSMYITAKWWDCIINLSTEPAPTALTALEFEPALTSRYVFTREEIPITETGSTCFHNYPFALVSGTFSTYPHLEAGV